MINRILIRIKAVQILYSFMLLEKHFSLESAPTAPTKEKRFAYSLYLDMLVLMLKVAEETDPRGRVRPLEETRFVKRLKTDETVKSLMAKYRVAPFPYEGVVESLANKVKESAIYRNLKENYKGGVNGADEAVWSEIYNLIIYPDATVGEITSQRENFTLRGVERSREMLNDTFANFMSSQESGADAINALRESLEKARELYFRLLWLPVELTDHEERRLDDRRHRHLVSAEDLNPNLKFVDNQLVKEIRNSDIIRTYIEKNKISWSREERALMDSLLRSILDSEYYKEYMSNPERSLKEDAELWKNLMKKVIYPNEFFLETLEDMSVYWNDDLDIIGTFVLKTMRRFEDGEGEKAVLEKYKDEEDARFGDELVKAVLRNKDQYRGMIDETIDRNLWESDRLAFMDVVIIETALAEILNFPKIPLTVSLNEYIEIAKAYSSHKSGGFVNGILAQIIRNLQESGKLQK